MEHLFQFYFRILVNSPHPGSQSGVSPREEKKNTTTTTITVVAATIPN